MNEGGFRGNEEGPVNAGDETGHSPHDGAAHEASKDDAYGPEIDDAAAGADVPVGAADGHDREEDDEEDGVFTTEMFG